MNQKLILKIVGIILCIEALCMLPPLLIAAVSSGSDLRAFFAAAVLCGGIGGLFLRKSAGRTLFSLQYGARHAMNFEGSSEEKKAKALLATLGIDYDAITMEQFVNLIEVLKLSKHLKTPISQRGKTTMTHGKGKRKKR